MVEMNGRGGERGGGYRRGDGKGCKDKHGGWIWELTELELPGLSLEQQRGAQRPAERHFLTKANTVWQS